MKRIGIVSDTHGLLRPEAVALLRGSNFIIHGGDIGDATILKQLALIAPVTAVRGNNDKGAWAQSVPATDVLQVEGVRIYVIHDISELALDPVAAGFQVVVSGHSHKPAVREDNRVLYVNPGSAGPRRFTLPIALAELVVADRVVSARVLEIEVAAPSKRSVCR